MFTILITLLIFLIPVPTMIFGYINYKLYESLDKKHYRVFRKKPDFYWTAEYKPRNWKLSRCNTYAVIFKQKNYDPNSKWFRHISKEEYVFIKKIPQNIQDSVRLEFMIRRITCVILLTSVALTLIATGGIDYLLEPISQEEALHYLSR